MKQVTIFGFTNYRYFVSNPHGETTWFATRAARDAGRAHMIACADREGLAGADDAFRCVHRVIRSERGHAWLDDLMLHNIRPINAMSHYWRGDDMP